MYFSEFDEALLSFMTKENATYLLTGWPPVSVRERPNGLLQGSYKGKTEKMGRLSRKGDKIKLVDVGGNEFHR